LVSNSHSTPNAQTQFENIFSFSLYGTKTLYHVGAIRNVETISTVFPDWGVVFFAGDSVPHQIIKRLEQYPSVICIRMAGLPENASSMFWRYLVLNWTHLKVACFRDADSRISQREYAAVSEWLQSSKAIHVMRDHPRHNSAILGGLWGVKSPFPREVLQEIPNFIWPQQYGDDMKFLANQIYHRFSSQVLVHQSSMYFKDVGGVETWFFPTPRVGANFVGEGFNADDSPRNDH
jgi:hypothetical protein